ncbi:hypothetical protein ACQK5W_04330 [Pantoea sp. FN060301]|uniref:phage tail fiber protein n=1 Tax=Pantoea sp. FN060301 TaxID=3420380 RepID=UPI003D182A79
MPAGTIKLTNNSTAVTGTGTSFTTELKPNDFLVAVVGGVTYTLGVDSVTSNTALVLKTAYNGPAATGQAWTPIPNGTLVGITAQVAADVAKAIRGLNLDKANWQQVFSGAGNITVNLTDGSQYTGPAWNSLSDSLSGKMSRNQNLNDVQDKAVSRNNLGLGTTATRNALSSSGSMLSEGDAGLLTFKPPLIEGSYFRYPSQVRRTGGVADGPGLRYGSGMYFGYDTDICFHLHIEGSGALRYRHLDAGYIRYDYTVYSTGNTTKSSDGSLKAASPVARIVKSQEDTQRTDVDESGFEWCGAGTCNDEARGISIARLETGVYTVTGSLGLAKEGWSLLPPRDPQGSGDLGIVEAEETESGGITVRLYKRKYILSDEGEIVLTKGTLIDVPPTSWIDIRLQMPEKESPAPIDESTTSS